MSTIGSTAGGRGAMVGHAGKDLLRLGDLTSEDLDRLRRFTADFGADPDSRRGALGDGTVLCWLPAPGRAISSTVSVASRLLGGSAVALDPHELQAWRVGTLENAGRVLSSLGHLIVVGGLADHDLDRLAAAASVPVVNAWSAGHDPCEALADLAALEQRLGTLRGVTLAYVGESCNVTHDLMTGAALAGATLWVATPQACQPSRSVTAHAEVLAARHGGGVQLTRRPAEAIARADGVVLGPRPPRWRHVDMVMADLGRRDVALLSCTPGGVIAAWPLDPDLQLEVDRQVNRRSAYQAVLYALRERLLEGAAREQPSS